MTVIDATIRMSANCAAVKSLYPRGVHPRGVHPRAARASRSKGKTR
jgi:hypothetical protein